MTMKDYHRASDEAAFFHLHRENWAVQVVARFTVDGEPASKARARFTNYGGKNRVYTPAKTLEAEERIGWAFRQAARGHKLTSDTAYGVTALFFHYKQQRRDVDNMLKLVLDGLNKIAWADDSQVTEVSGRKDTVYYADDARTEVVVYAIGPMSRREAVCEECKKRYPTFDSWTGKRRFCSADCRKAHRAARRLRTCPSCGERFSDPSYRAIYCSMKCKSAAGRVQLTCVQCGQQYTRPRSLMRKGLHLCGDECRQDYWREKRKISARGTCIDCGGPTSKKTYRRCAQCRPNAARKQSVT